MYYIWITFPAFALPFLSDTSFAFHSSTYRRFNVQVCASWFAFTFTACLPWRNRREQTWQAVVRNQHFLKFFSCTVLFDTTEGSLFHQLEVRNDSVHEVWWLVAGVGKHLVPSLFYAELGGSLGVRFIGHAPLWYLGQGRLAVTEISRVFVQGDTCTPLFFIPFTEERMNFEAEAPHRPRCPLSPPSLLHSPYLLPLFARQPSCSALMRGHPKLLGWRKGGRGLTHFSKCHQRGHRTRHVGWSSFCFLCIFFFSVWFPWQWLSRIYILVTC